MYNDYVFGFDVAMNDALVVRIMYSLCHIEKQVQDLQTRKKSVPFKFSKILPRDEGHDKPKRALTKSVDLHDATVLEHSHRIVAVSKAACLGNVPQFMGMKNLECKLGM